jgi:prepilin-type N-terminal cleavage/methylation domain-containing protein
MNKLRKNNQAGFTLIEMLVTVLILGVLAAAGGAVYLGYVKDAKTAEAKAVIGSVWTALQACAQAVPSTACTTADQYGRAGLTAAGATADTRWTITGGTLTMAAATGILTLAAPIVATAEAGAADITGIVVTFNYITTGNPPGTFTCLLPPSVATPC